MRYGPALGRMAPVRALLLLGLTSCLDPTQVTLEITTNLECGAEEPSAGALFETAITAGPTPDLPRETRATTRACSSDGAGRSEIGTLTLVPTDGASRAYALVVGSIGETPASECLLAALAPAPAAAPACVVARRTISFAPHKSLSLPVFLDRQCAGVLCDADSTCVVRDGRPGCVSSATECSGERCDVDVETSGGGGAGGAAEGGGGAGGAEGGGGAGGAEDVPVLERLDTPTNMTDARAAAISDDGSVIVGNAFSGTEVRAVAWRAGEIFVAPTRSRMMSVCKGGDLAVGASWPGPTSRATAWQWQGAGYAQSWIHTGPLESDAEACSDASSIVMGIQAGQGATWTLGQGATVDTTTEGLFWDASNSATVAVGVLADGRPGLWPLSAAGVIGGATALGAEAGVAWAVDADATLAAGNTGEAVVVWDLLAMAPLVTLMADFQPSAVAGSASSYIVVGNCDPFVVPRACVIVDGEGPFDIDGLAGVPWSSTAVVDFGGLSLTDASDVSKDGRVIAGNALDPSTGEASVYRLTLP